MLAMNNVRSFAFLFPATLLLGCTLPTAPMSPPGASSPVAGNWQIQSGTAITSPPTVPYLVGALQGTNSALTGTFTTAGPSTASPAVDSYSGTYDASTGALFLDSPLPPQVTGVIATLSLPTYLNDLATGSIVFQCGLCALGQSFPVVGAEIAPLNGTYTGTLSGTLTTISPATTTPISGTASVTFAQSTTPNASGQFPLIGTITMTSISGLDAFTVSEMSGPASLSGLVSGVTIVLGTPPCEFCTAVVAGFMISANTNPAATQIAVSNLTYGASNSFSFAGTLTLQ